MSSGEHHRDCHYVKLFHMAINHLDRSVTRRGLVGGLRGFTLIELLVVISIIGMLASVVLASLSGARAKGVVAAAQTFDTHIYHAFGAGAYAIFNFDDGQVNPPTDTSGNGIVLTTCSGLPTSVAGIIGSGMNFTNTAYCTSPSSLSLYNISNPSVGTISFWTQPTSYVSKSYFAIVQSVLIQEDTSGHVMIGYTPDCSTFIPNTLISNASVITNQWNHVLVTFGSGSVRIYINGKLDNSVSDANVIFRSCNFRLGYQSVYRTAPSTLDQFAVYTQSMQTAEVEKLYASELPRHMLAKAGK